MVSLRDWRLLRPTETHQCRKDQERQRADRHRKEGDPRSSAEVPGGTAEHGYQESLGVAGRKHSRRHAADVGGRANSGGRVMARVNTTAPTNPSTPAQATVHRLAVMTIPAKHSSISTPDTTKGHTRRTNLSAVASSAKDAGSWPKLSAVSAALIKSGRPASVR